MSEVKVFEVNILDKVLEKGPGWYSANQKAQFLLWERNYQGRNAFSNFIPDSLHILDIFIQNTQSCIIYIFKMN